MNYRKKPVIVQALQFDGTYHSMKQILEDVLFKNIITVSSLIDEEHDCVEKWEIQTLEGAYTLTPGDYIIRGIVGEYYPCREDIFYSTYEPIDDKANQGEKGITNNS